jgi:hypothetical protein
MNFLDFFSTGSTIIALVAGFILGWIVKKKSISHYKKKINRLYNEIKKRDSELLKPEDKSQTRN